MRVKITYTVELEEVEKEVAEIMSKAIQDLDYSYQEAVRVQLDLDTKTGDMVHKIEQLDIIRKKLAKADQTLADCYLILEGLDLAKKQLKEQENEVQDG